MSINERRIIENFDKNELGNVLSRFYVEARSDGNHYKTGSLNSVPAGLNRHLKQNYHLRSGTVDIIRDREFVAANIAFKAAIVELKKYEKAMCSNIKQLMKMTLRNCTVPVYSTKILLLDYNLKVGLKRELKKDHFVVATDSDGRQYVTQAVDELTKMTREDNQSSRTDAGRMYETSTDQCPVRSFMKYRSKLNPECETLFQTPKSAILSDVDSPWYKKMPVGKHTLGNFMSLISNQAQLSRPYTNHCIRATCISILHSRGFYWPGYLPNL